MADASRDWRIGALAAEEARGLGHDTIGTGHLLLALLRTGDPDACAALGASGVGLDGARRAVAGLVRAAAPPAPRGPMPFTPRARDALEASLLHARPGEAPRPAHLLLGVLDVEDGTAVRALRALGVAPGDVRPRATPDGEA